MKIDSEKIILFHSGKTGGTSIEHTLRDMYLGKNFKLDSTKPDYNIMFGFDKSIGLYLQHLDIIQYGRMGIQYQEYKTIATIRRPYDKILSCYFYNGKSEKYTFEDFVLNRLEKLFKVNEQRGCAVNHFSLQSYYTHCDNYTVDYIIRLENFSEDCSKAGLDVKYHHSKTEGTKKYTDYLDAYNSKMKDVVRNLYKEDFKNYGYK